MERLAERSDVVIQSRELLGFVEGGSDGEHQLAARHERGCQRERVVQRVRGEVTVKAVGLLGGKERIGLVPADIPALGVP